MTINRDKWKKKDPKGFAICRNKQRKSNYKKGNFRDNKKIHRYNYDEEMLIIAHIISDRELAKELKTSVEAIQLKRCRLLK